MRRTGGAGSGHAGRACGRQSPTWRRAVCRRKNKPCRAGGSETGGVEQARSEETARGRKPPFAQCGEIPVRAARAPCRAGRSGVAFSIAKCGAVCKYTHRAGAWGRGRACHAWPGTRTEKPTGRCTGSAKCLLLAVQARAEGAEVIPAMRREGLRYPNFADDGGAGRKPSQDGWRGRV